MVCCTHCTHCAQCSLFEVADIGTLQMIQRCTSRGFARELAFTGAGVAAQRAMQFGFLNELYANKDAMLAAARSLARSIADNSALVTQGVKHILNYSEDHTVADSLQQVAVWNAAFLPSDDLAEAMRAFLTKTKPLYTKSLL
jgi:enoyl-CoA hydratase